MTVDRLRLARTEGVGPVTYRRLLYRYGTAAAALEALPAIARATTVPIPTAAQAERELDGVARLGGRILFVDDPDYPPLLRLLENPPPLLAILGDPGVFQHRAIGLVGARNASANGRRMAEILASAIAGQGMTVVSGLARGIDGAAHEGAMQGGQTIAAVAGGLDQPYPPEHAGLQARIVGQGGVIVAEAPLGTAPQARHFPRRNRVIAGLSEGVVVVEAARQSGSLLTARLAIEASRELFAVPGSPLDPRCLGSNDLIRSGAAHLTESVADILAHLPDQVRRMPLGLAETQAAFDADADPGPRDDALQGLVEDPTTIRMNVLQMLSPAWVPVDDLLRRCQFSPSGVLGVLAELEAEGHVQHAGSQVCRIVQD